MLSKIRSRQNARKLFGMSIALRYIILSAFLAGATSASAATYYVDSAAGNNANNGTSEATAWKTFDKLNQALHSNSIIKPGDTVLLKRGSVWRDTLALFNTRGSANQPIVVDAYGSATDPLPIINGGYRIEASDWVPLNDPGLPNVYVATIGSTIIEIPDLDLPNPAAVPINLSNPGRDLQLLVGEKLLNIAHHPNAGLRYGEGEYLTASGDGSSIFEVRDSDHPLTAAQASDLVGATLVAKNALWRVDAPTIESFDAANSRFNLYTDQNVYPRMQRPMTTGYGYFLSNKKWMLDSPGEWFFEPTSRAQIDGIKKVAGKVYVYSTTPPAAAELSARREGINSVNAAHLTIRNLKVVNHSSAGVYTHAFGGPVTQDVTLENLVVSNAPFGITSNPAQRVTLRNNMVTDSGINGITVGGTNNTISNNVVRNTGTAGVSPMQTPYGIRLTQNSAYNTVSHNIVIHSAHAAIRFDGANNTIRNNRIDYFCVRLDDCGGIYTFSQTLDNNDVGNVIEKNIITNGIGNYAGTPLTFRRSLVEGIYLDDRSRSVKVLDNIVSNVDHGLYIHNGYGHEVKGNGFFGSRVNGIQIVEDELSVTNGHVRENIISNNIIEVVEDPRRAPTDPVGFFGSNAPVIHISTLGTTERFATYSQNQYFHPQRSVVFTLRPRTGGNQNFTLLEWQAAMGQDYDSTIRIRRYEKIDDVNTYALRPAIN